MLSGIAGKKRYIRLAPYCVCRYARLPIPAPNTVFLVLVWVPSFPCKKYISCAAILKPRKHSFHRGRPVLSFHSLEFYAKGAPAPTFHNVLPVSSSYSAANDSQWSHSESYRTLPKSLVARPSTAASDISKSKSACLLNSIAISE